MKNTIDPADINGHVPDLEGQRCRTLLCLECWHEGELVEEANVVHLAFDGPAYRLYFDHGIVFWREEAPPEPTGELPVEASAEPQEETGFRPVDIAAIGGVRGKRLLELALSHDPRGSVVSFSFENGTAVIFHGSYDDRATWELATRSD